MTNLEYAVENFIYTRNFQKYYYNIFGEDIVSFFNKSFQNHYFVTVIVEIHSNDNSITFDLKLSHIYESSYEKRTRCSCEDFEEFIEKFEKEYNTIIESI